MKKIRRYKFELILILLQLSGPYVGVLGVILASFYSFYVISFKRRIDLLQIFLLLIPVIVLRSSSFEINSIETVENFIWFKFSIPILVNSVLIGPLNVSVKLAMAFGVFVRLILTIKEQKNSFLFFIWIICLLISLYGLYISRSMGMESAGGLTVGLRIVLSIGAFLIPLSLSKETLLYDINIISKISIILFLFGFMSEYWLFVFPCLLPFLYSNQTKSSWKFLGVLLSLIFLIMDYTFTLKITVLLSWLLIYVNDNKFIIKKLFRNKLFRLTFFLSPILIVLYAIKDTSLFFLTNDDGIINHFLFKFYADRGALWFYTLNMVFESNFFYVPAGRDIIIEGNTLYGTNNFGVGAHNIYLEMARQIGSFATILLTIIMSIPIFKLFKFTNNKNYLGKLGLVFIGVYFVFGLTGNSLVYDGVGFLFWLIIGQLYNSSLTNKQKQH